ncbi:MAG: hypothetical protein WAT19_01180 [Ferruginibacter sp.]
MNLSAYKLGYFPNTPDLQRPGDRRRFVFYAREKNVSFQIASPKQQYDIVYLTMGCNIAAWLRYRKQNPGVKIIFEIIDSYVLEKPGLLNLARGLVRWLAKKESKLFLDYKKAMLSMVKCADAVVCSSGTQQQFLLKYNNNVHVSLDYFLDDINCFKTSYASPGNKLKLVWEGQAYTVHNLLVLKNVLKNLSEKIELHIITDPEVIFPFKIFNKKTKDILSGIACDKYFYTWQKESFAKLLSQMDLAVIPIGSHDALHWNKPENKLLMLWQTGIPTLTSNTPAYTKVMNTANLQFLCSTEEEWTRKIEQYMEMDEQSRMAHFSKATQYLNNHHTKEIILKKWDAIFESVIMCK